uniref:C2H2-type domain-containing protein n=1 Tax=Panagrolaimus sp. JU765 TaxID=591449 RepID=A0AC34REV3_9BILA
MAVDFGQFHEALQCPKCPDLFVESLWSLIAHVNSSHSELCTTFLNFKTLQGFKKIVPKSKVCVIRPAFKDDGSRNDFLNFGPDGSFVSTESSPNLNLSTSLDSELTEASQNAVTAFSQALAMISDESNPTDKLLDDSEDGSSPGLTNGGNKRVKRQLPYSRNTKKQVCTTCGEIFDNRCLLTLHMMDHKRKTHPFQCPITGCFQCYDSRSKFKSHLTRVHRELTADQLETLVFAFEERKVKKLLTKDEILAVKTSEVVERLIEALPTASAAFEETQRKISLYLASNLILGLVRVHHYQVDCFVTSIERALERIDEPVPEAEIVRHDEGYNLDLSPLPPFSPLHELEPDILPPLEELDNLAVEEPMIEDRELDNLAVEEPMVEDRGPIEDVAEGQQIQEEGMDVQVEGQVAPAPKERRRRRKRRYSDESEESDRAPRQRRTRRKRAGARNFTARHEDITMPADQPAQLLDELERDLAGDDLVPLEYVDYSF